MTRYTGNHCPVCEQAFTDEDDIVVCPDCGTPYHRACWQKLAYVCTNPEHAAGFEWQPEVDPDADKAAHEATCPNCRHPLTRRRGALCALRLPPAQSAGPHHRQDMTMKSLCPSTPATRLR